MKEEQIALIRQKCIEANPEKEPKHGGGPFGDCAMGRCEHSDPAIRLADVLLATCKKTTTGYVKAVGQAQNDIVVAWNWMRDDLTEQSDETISFLYDLLQ